MLHSRFSASLSDPKDPLALIRDAINATYHRATVEQDNALRVLAMTMLAHLAKERRAAGIPEIRANARGGQA